MAKSRYVLDGEVLTFSRYGEDKRIVEDSKPLRAKSAAPVRKAQPQRTRPATPPSGPDEDNIRTYSVNQTSNLGLRGMRPDTPPKTEKVENKFHRTHVKVS